jgi:predicted amidohydrolase YtcJ
MKNISAGSYAEKADTVFINGVIYTADSKNSFVEAIAVGGGKILLAGSNSEAESYKKSASEVIDLAGRMILPGFIDTHLHAPGRALTDLYNISLYEARDELALVETVETFVAENPDLEIYYGEGFSIGLFRGEEVSRGPRKERLDRICSDKPVVLYSADCHLAWLNSRAFEAFGITAQTPSPAGGVIEKDPAGSEPWGTLKEAAMRLIPDQQFSAEQIEKGLYLFQEFLHGLGYTGILSASISAVPPIDLFYSMAEKGDLKLHVCSSVTIDPETDLDEQFEKLIEMRAACSSGNHRVTTAKFFADGVVEGATAFLFEPYSPSAGKGDLYRGELLWEPDRLQEAFYRANRAGFQVHVHSIGDASTRIVLDALERVREKIPAADCRNTITHLQLVDPVDIERFARLSVIASIQPYWHSKEPGWWDVVDRHMLGERAEKEYPLQSFFRAGAVVASSSDHPVTPVPNPLRAIRAGLTRNRTAEESYGLAAIDNIDDPAGLLNREERASLTDMIKSFTANGAYALFCEEITGILERGKCADLVILDRNIFTVDPLELEKVRIMRTYFKGELVYSAEK